MDIQRNIRNKMAFHIAFCLQIPCRHAAMVNHKTYKDIIWG